MNKLALITSIAVVGLMTPAFAQQSPSGAGSSSMSSGASTQSTSPSRSMDQMDQGSSSHTTGRTTDIDQSGATNQSTSAGNTRVGSNTADADSSQTAAIPANNLDQDKVREVQQALKDQTSPDLQVDGLWGPQTQDAIREFQRAQSLEPSNGQLNEKTVSALGLDPDEFSGR